MDLDQQFGFLDALPDSLFDTVVTTRHGRLAERVVGVLQWRTALLEGRMPSADELSWPEAEITTVLLPRLEVMELATLCRDEESLTDHLLKDLCTAVDSVAEWRERDLLGLFEDSLPQSRRQRRTASELPPEERGLEAPEGSEASDAGAGDKPGSGQAPPPGANGGAGDQLSAATPSPSPSAAGAGETPPSEAQPQSADASKALAGESPEVAEGPTVAEAAATQNETYGEPLADPSPQAADDVDGNALAADGALSTGTAADGQVIAETTAEAHFANCEQLQQRWQALAEQWREAEAIARGLGTRLGRGWDLSEGLLHSEGWREFVRLRRWIANRPELIAIVNQLGRADDARSDGAQHEPPQPDTDCPPPPVPGEPQGNQHDTAVIPPALRGISRSDDIARMLPQEAAFLGHPKLRLLWHARRAERSLLSYQVEGVHSTRVPEPQPLDAPADAPQPKEKRLRGPITLCLDTSASMHGEPEQLAKALCLEVLRLANQQQRDCLLFAFSGPGQLLECELRFDAQGLHGIIDFLRQSFHGGSDIRTPIEHALQRLREHRWQRADLLLVSDGRFPVPRDLVELLEQARTRQAIRVQCIRVGAWRSGSVAQLCDALHRFQSASEA